MRPVRARLTPNRIAAFAAAVPAALAVLACNLLYCRATSTEDHTFTVTQLSWDE